MTVKKMSDCCAYLGDSMGAKTPICTPPPMPKTAPVKPSKSNKLGGLIMLRCDCSKFDKCFKNKNTYSSSCDDNLYEHRNCKKCVGYKSIVCKKGDKND